MMTPAELWAVAPRAPRTWHVDALPVVLAAVKGNQRGIVYAATGAGKSDAQAATLRAIDRAPGWVDVVVVPTQALVEQMAADLKRWSLKVGRFYGVRQEVESIIVVCLPSVQRLAEELEDDDLRVRLVLVDEAHRVGAAKTVSALAALRPGRVIGWSATPVRTKNSAVLRELWPAGILFGYSMTDAIRDGAIVPPRFVRNHDPDMVDANELTLRMIQDHAVGPIVVSASDVKDAEWYAAWLTERDVPAKHIDGTMGRGRRKVLLEELRTGKIRALVHVRLLTEGVDLPWLGTLAMRWPTESVVRYVQEAGRVLRTFPDKTEGVILDPHNLWDKFKLPRFSADNWATLDELEAAAAKEAEPPDEKKETERAMREAAYVADLESWLADIHQRLVVAGVIEPQGHGSGWRYQDPTENQLKYTTAWAETGGKSPKRWLPEAWREKYHALVLRAESMSRGGVADLLDIGFGVKRRAAERFKASGAWDWRMPADIEL
jgi:superfamily II DNA or RNA helicase